MMELKKWLQSQGENKRAFYIFTILSLVLCFFLIVNACYVIYGTRYNEYKVTQNAIIDLVKPDGTIQKNINSRFFYPGGSRIRIHVPVSLHSDKKQYTLTFTAARVYYQVSWNGQILSYYDESRISRNHNFGAVICMAELPASTYGSTITIEEELLSSTSIPYIGDIFVIPTRKSYTYYLQREGFFFILYHALLTLSLSAFLVLLFLKKSLLVKKGLAISLFLTSFILWCLCYHHMTAFWIDSPYINSLLEYGSLYFLPAPFLYFLFLSEKEGKRRTLYHHLSLWFVLLFAAAFLLQAGGLYTLDDMLPLLHISIILSGILVCWYQLHPLGKEKTWQVVMRWGILLSSGAAALDTAQYYITSGHSIIHIYVMQALSTWALLVFVFSVILSYVFQILAQAEEAQEKKAALHLAYHDALTGLYNHAGIFHIAKSLDSRKSYALLFMDLNGLKEVNDRYGHEAGDFFLCHMAKILSSVTPSSAFCGRLGGDEFIILLPPHEADSLFPLIKTIRKKMQELKGLPHMPKDPSASFGWSIHDPSQPLSFDDHLNEADDRMYEEKEKYKLTHPAEEGRNFRREK